MARYGWIALLALATAMAAGGCAAPALSADDTIILDGSASPIRVVAWRPGLIQWQRRIPDVEVALYVGDQEILREVTDESGNLDVEPKFPKGTTEFEARAAIGEKELSAVGRVFTWKTRTIVIVDIDQTISNTDFDSLLSGADDDVKSQPLPGSVETVNQISEHFNLCYLTARPREVLDKTRRWLDTHGFPAAPVVTAESLGDVLDQQGYKQRTIKDIKDVIPEVLIGIGDTVTDSEAYGANGLLTIVITEGVRKGFRSHGILLPDWAAVGRFFENNRDTLTDPRKLAKTLEEAGFLLRQVNRWQPKKK